MMMPEFALLNFSKRVGVVVTYILFDAMARGNKILAEIYSGKDRMLTDDSKDVLIMNWIGEAITSIIPRLPAEFKEVVYMSTKNYPADFDGRVMFMRTPPKLAIDYKVAKQAFAAFEKLFPHKLKALRRISEGLPDAIDIQKGYIERADRGEFPKRAK
jgi:hypothetical protein